MTASVAAAEHRVDSPPFEFSLDPIHWSGCDSFSVMRLADAQRRMRAFERPSILGVSEPGRFGGYTQSEIRLGAIRLSRTSICSPEGYSLEFRPQGEYCLNIPRRGRGAISSSRHRVELAAGGAVLVMPGQVVRKEWLGPSDVLTVHIPSNLMLEVGADRLMGGAPLGMVSEAGVTALLHLLSGVCGSLAAGDALADRDVSQHVERAIVALAAKSLVAAAGEGGVASLSGAAPYYVHRAERFMRANFRPGVTLDDMAAAAGVSRRTLQYGFRRYHQMTPMHFFRKIRLEHARAQLLDGGDIAMIQLAWEVGYQNSSHFGSDYRAFFGEAPSHTQARARETADLMGLPAFSFAQ